MKNLNQFHLINFKSNLIPIGLKNGLNGNINSNKVKSLKIRNIYKFNRIIRLANNLHSIKQKLENILENSKDDIEKECSFSLLMMIESGIRVGNEDSANGYICKVKNHKLYDKEIKTYGLTTLLKEHLIFEKEKLNIKFIGKKGIEQNIEIKDEFLIKWNKYFLNKNKNNLLTIDKIILKKFIEKNIGKYFIVKDFRTLKACLEAGINAKIISERPSIKTYKEFNKEIKEVLVNVSNHLGNTPAICRTAYINPDIFNWLALNRFPDWIRIEKEKEIKREKAKKLKDKKLLQEKNKKISQNLKNNKND